MNQYIIPIIIILFVLMLVYAAIKLSKAEEFIHTEFCPKCKSSENVKKNCFCDVCDDHVLICEKCLTLCETCRCGMTKRGNKLISPWE